jgi:large subunit ribosomal protein L10
MNRTEKELIVTSLQEKLRGAKTAIITDYRGLNVAELSSLRKDLREADTEYYVVKNTFAKRALQGTPMEPLEPYFTGPSAIALNLNDPAAPAKVLSKFTKDNPKLEIKIGFLEGKVISLYEIQKLATISSRENLLASLLGTLQAPATGMVNALSGILRKFFGTLEAIRIGKIQQ